MLLTIDAGNTNTVFAVFEQGKLRGEWRTATDERRTADEYAVWLFQLFALAGLDRHDIKDAVVASVVPNGLFALRKLCRDYFSCEALVVGDEGVKLGIRVKVDRPTEVGADRVVNALAAGRRYGGSVIVIDFGTATTFDVVDKNGDYAGGIICPGVHLSLEALHQAAAKLPKIGVERPPQVIGTTTVSAMQSGVYWGYVSMIEGLIKRITDECGAPMRVIATGGLAPLFAKATPVIERHDPDLTIFGLLEIYTLNRTQAQVKRCA